MNLSESNYFRAILLALFLISAVLLPCNASAYPDAEVIWDAGGGPPFTFGVTSTLSGFGLASDRRLIVSYGEVVKLIDVGSFALEAVQPAALSTDEETNGVITGIGFAEPQNKLLASQEDGDLLFFDLSSPATTPTSLAVATGDKLGTIVMDSGGRYAYVADNSAHKIHVIDLITETVSSAATLTIPNVTTFTVTDGTFVSSTKEAYFSTDVGAVFYLPSGGATATMIDLGVSLATRPSLSAIAAFPGGNAIYVVDATTPEVVKIDTATHAKSGSAIDISANSSPSDVVIPQVENPLGIYAYVAGARGVSVINTATGEVFDFGTDPNVNGEPMPLSAEPYVMAASSDTDGMVYAGFSTGGLGVISERPFAAITSVTYSGGGSVLKIGGSVDLTFMANATGTYEIRANGSVDASGTLLVDSSGSSSGTVSAADTEITVTINYDDNKTSFLEGTNDIWIFITGETGRGRRAAQITVDTPPPDVVIESAGFGNARIYVNFERLTVNDMASYNVYVDTDPDAVLTKTDAAASVSQPSSGTVVKGEVNGLTNGTLYYIAVEGVDQSGNKSINRTGTLSNGEKASATPERTEGPAGFSGEKGCSLAGGRPSWLCMAMIPALLLIIWRARRKKTACHCESARVIARSPEPCPRTTKQSHGVKEIASPFGLAMTQSFARNDTKVHGAMILVFLFITLYSSVASAAAGESVEERNVPATPTVLTQQGKGEPWWSIEVKTGFWMPQSADMKRFFSSCCNLVTRVQGGLLAHRRYGAELGVGFLYKTGTALAADTGEPSEDSFSFMLIPIELSFTWRADYFDWRYIVPYLKAGVDGWVFRESVAGDSTSGIKFGMHGAGGMQINISKIGGVEKDFESIGISDFFLTLETQYQWINNFGGKGLDLTGPIFSAGFLFEF